MVRYERYGVRDNGIDRSRRAYPMWPLAQTITQEKMLGSLPSSPHTAPPSISSLDISRSFDTIVSNACLSVFLLLRSCVLCSAWSLITRILLSALVSCWPSLVIASVHGQIRQSEPNRRETCGFAPSSFASCSTRWQAPSGRWSRAGRRTSRCATYSLSC